MNNGDGVHAHKRLKLWLKDGPVDISMGIGTIQNDDAFSIFGTRLHHVGQCADVRIKASANILDVEDNDINVRQLFRCGLMVLTING